jgi:hypothetical protein
MTVPPQPNAPEEGAPAPQPAKVSRWEDLVDIFASPAEVFERRRHSSAWFPIIVVAVVSFALYLATKPLMQPIYDAMFDKMLAAAQAANPQVTAAQMERGRGIGNVVGALGQLIGVPIFIAIGGLILWVVGKFVDAKESIGAAIMVVAFSAFPALLQWVVFGIEGALMDPAKLTSMHSISLSAARLVDSASVSPVVMALLTRVDLFVIWSTILVAIGLSVTGRITRGRAAAAAVVFWAVSSLLTVLGALSGRVPT